MPEQTGQKYDVTIKSLFSGSEEGLIEYFGGITLEDVRPLNVEFNRIEMKSSDLVVRGLRGNEPAICHMEFQTTDDPKMQMRMLRYATEIYDSYGDFPYQILLYLGSYPA